MEVGTRCWLVDTGGKKASSLVTLLQSQGWDMQRMSPPFAESGDLERTDCAIGVILLEDMPCKLISQLEPLIIKSHCLWLAVASAAALEDMEKRRLVATLCHGVVDPDMASAELGCLMTHAARLSWLQRQDVERRHSAAAMSSDAAEYEMVGTTPAMWKLFQTIRKVAAVDAPVFISGESGTGKELVARSIMAASDRAGRPFVTVNCGAIPENLVESVLFGHEKGAFTGAVAKHMGKFQEADGGTLFLDEIGDMSLDLQSKLLRLLQERCVQRIGGNQDIQVDIRVITASHKDLQQGVNQGTFRLDLYYRLNVIPLRLPPLRQRRRAGTGAKGADPWCPGRAESVGRAGGQQIRRGDAAIPAGGVLPAPWHRLRPPDPGALGGTRRRAGPAAGGPLPCPASSRAGHPRR